MKLASFLIGGKPGYGLVTDNGVVDLSRRFPECATLRDFLAAGLQAKAAALSGEAADHALDAITFAPTHVRELGMSILKGEMPDMLKDFSLSRFEEVAV